MKRRRRSVFDFRNWPISHKLAAIVLLTSGLLISFMAIAVTVEKYYSFRSQLVKSSTALATIIGGNCTAALIFQDDNAAYEMISALEAEKNLIAARVFDRHGQSFASYENPGFPPAMTTLPKQLHHKTPQSDPIFQGNSFDVKQPIILGGKLIGAIMVRTDLSSLNRQQHYFVITIIVFSLLLFSVGLLICSRLNRSITGPVAQLAATMQDVTIKKNFDLRVEKTYNDEIGLLIDGFNSMLSQIQKRDQEIALHQNHLEDLVITRTQELQISNNQLLAEIEERQDVQAKLAHAQKMEAIGTLAGGVAHDLNNLLSGVVSYPDLLLLDLPIDSPLRKPIETIRSSGKKAAAIVQDLLTLARRGVRLEEEMDLHLLILDYLASPEREELRRTHPLVEIVFPHPIGSYPMIGSPIHIEKTVMNLVVNAAEAMPNGGTITIELEKVHLDTGPVDFKQWRKGPYLHFTITDTGIGIPAGYIERIFEPFYSRKVMGRSGTGLGMAVVWGTIQDHRGHNQVASIEGKGTSIQIFFPEATAVEPAEPVEAGECHQRGHGEKILVVDDSTDQRLIASEILTHLGYAALVVASGEEAVTYLRQHTVDLVVLDMLMAPGMDGLETYSRIIDVQPDLPAVIASGYAHSEMIAEAEKIGIADYILKPYTVLRLGNAVHAALTGGATAIPVEFLVNESIV